MRFENNKVNPKIFTDAACCAIVLGGILVLCSYFFYDKTMMTTHNRFLAEQVGERWQVIGFIFLVAGAIVAVIDTARRDIGRKSN